MVPSLAGSRLLPQNLRALQKKRKHARVSLETCCALLCRCFAEEASMMCAPYWSRSRMSRPTLLLRVAALAPRPPSQPCCPPQLPQGRCRMAPCRPPALRQMGQTSCQVCTSSTHPFTASVIPSHSSSDLPAHLTPHCILLLLTFHFIPDCTCVCLMVRYAHCPECLAAGSHVLAYILVCWHAFIFLDSIALRS